MAKDPAFLFYSQDFIVGVQTMTYEDRGKYITILSQMHQQGRMDEETIRFIVGSISDKLRLKFKQDEKGLWFNERLELETEKRNNFTDSRRNNGKNGGRPKKEEASAKPKPNHKQNHMVNHMENENVNEDVNEIKIGDARGKIEAMLFAAIGDLYLDGQRPKWQHINFEFEVNTFKEKVRGSPEDYYNHDTNGIRKAFQYQLRYAKTTQHNGSGNNKNGKQQHTSSLIEGFKARHGGGGN
jgi:hypothetical protein